jgi:hypothetical protein
MRASALPHIKVTGDPRAKWGGEGCLLDRLETFARRSAVGMAMIMKMNPLCGWYLRPSVNYGKRHSGSRPR